MKTPMRQLICFLDFETTGSNPYQDFPIQIGAVLANQDLEIIKRFSSLIRPPGEASNTEMAYQVHKIDLKTLQNAPPPENVLKDFFKEFGTNYRFASWNTNFDVSFFRKLCTDYNKMKNFNKINYRHIDVQTVCAFVRQLGLIDFQVISLDDCVNYFGLNRSIHHEAQEDALLVLEVYKNLLEISKSSCIITKVISS